MAEMLVRPFARMVDAFGSWEQWRKDMGLGPHRGCDWEAAEGTPIPASGVGVVVSEGWNNALGWWVVVRYATPLGEVFIGYCHMGTRTTLRYGNWVERGSKLGVVGNTGSASAGAHLHMTASWTNGDPGIVPVIDPMQFFAGSATAGTGSTTPVSNSEDIDMSITFIPDAQSATIRVLNTDTGKYAGIGSPYHMQLLDRARKNGGGDKMLVAELDIVAGYLQAISEADVNQQAILDSIHAIAVKPETIAAAIKAQGLTIDAKLTDADVRAVASVLAVEVGKTAVTADAIVSALKGVISEGITVDASVSDEQLDAASQRLAKLIGIRIAGGDIAGS